MYKVSRFRSSKASLDLLNSKEYRKGKSCDGQEERESVTQKMFSQL